MYVDKLEIDNFRCFEHTEFRLNHPDRTDWGGADEPALKNVNLFLGDNGAGKSSVFKAVALGVLGPILGSSGYMPEYLVRRGPPRDAVPKRMEVFVMIPYRQAEDLYDTVIKPAIESASSNPKLTAAIVHDQNYVGPVFESIQKSISTAQLCLADVTGANPNVLWEVGYAQALGKPIIFIAAESSLASIPFDIRHNRIILYNPSGAGLKQEIERAIEAVVATDRAMIGISLSLHESDTDQPTSPFTSEVRVSRIADAETIASSFDSTTAFPAINTNNSPGFFLVGYGANRRNERPEGYSESSRLARYQRVASIFEEHVGLVPFTYAHLQLKNLGYLDQATGLLNNLLPNDISLTEHTDSQRRPLFDWNGVQLPFNALSDGYRSYTGWLWDMVYQLAVVQDDKSLARALIDIPGVCIVDEIDLFLHPEWQRLVVNQVAQAFPKIQFLFSSHSPIVAGTLEPANIFVMEGDKVEQYRERIYGFTPNQILTSSYFGLASTRAPGTGTLSDLAKLTLGIEDQVGPTEQANPEDAEPTVSEASRTIFKRIAAQARAGASKSAPTTRRKKGAKS